jgi:hypothetical protein
MPLISAGQKGFIVSEPPRGVAYRMQIEGKSPPEFVLALATCMCLQELEPNELIDQFGAMGVAERNRARIETAASRLFDRETSLERLANGQKFLRVTSDDI